MKIDVGQEQLSRWIERAKNIQWTVGASTESLAAVLSGSMLFTVSDDAERFASGSLLLAPTDAGPTPILLAPSRPFRASDPAFLVKNAQKGAQEQLFDQEKISLYQKSNSVRLQGLDIDRLLSIATDPLVRRALGQKRPGLQYLIQQVDRDTRAWYADHPPKDLYDQLEAGHLARLAGEVPKVNPMVRGLLNALEDVDTTDTDRLLAGIDTIITTFFHRPPALSSTDANAKKDPESEKARASNTRKRDLLSDEALQEEMSVGGAEFAGFDATETKKMIEGESFSGRGNTKTEKERRNYVLRHYGPSLLFPIDEERLRRRTATGLHQEAHPWLTRGELTTASAYRLREIEEATNAHRAYLSTHRSSIKRQIRVLTDRLTKAKNAENEEGLVRRTHGTLVAPLAWKAVHLDQSKIFRHKTYEEPGGLIVDILLDASASQMEKKSVVASQGYVLGMALSAVGLTFRVQSFQSQQGYTILTMLNDYDEPLDPASLLRYFPDGANRDGYALRLVKETMRRKPGSRNLLFVLSDGKPFDQRILLNAQTNLRVRQYQDQLAVEDTAFAVRALEREGIQVFGMFTGDEEALPDAQKIYGQSFAYSPDPARFAEVAGTVLERELR